MCCLVDSDDEDDGKLFCFVMRKFFVMVRKGLVKKSMVKKGIVKKVIGKKIVFKVGKDKNFKKKVVLKKGKLFSKFKGKKGGKILKKGKGKIIGKVLNGEFCVNKKVWKFFVNFVKFLDISISIKIIKKVLL